MIDVPAQTHDAEVSFWRNALGAPLEQYERFPEYHGANPPGEGFRILTQRLGDGPARVHVDIHTDDRAAEVARLQKLGATLVDDGEHWAIMRDPAGLPFCVIPDPYLDTTAAHLWP